MQRCINTSESASTLENIVRAVLRPVLLLTSRLSKSENKVRTMAWNSLKNILELCNNRRGLKGRDFSCVLATCLTSYINERLLSLNREDAMNVLAMTKTCSYHLFRDIETDTVKYIERVKVGNPQYGSRTETEFNKIRSPT